ncbi:MAG: Cys-tRNA(Pro) deacylase [Desulfobulbus sp.]|jgi:Cys-tRNA(Pro)/Cys-tRNA(Cys) deacylase|uniref:Cys-tRNA(Pro) deacylase n=1 Tax=Desulfobulbus sp. TaxID=895 RepID=UPI00284AB039|nr:Cys-tRNA(Pro) deacylase [Desulfobulbus sp.]MDR2550940.1 Cys-tRNA(Pro) deacylase [Desulfobulbus sp.]
MTPAINAAKKAGIPFRMHEYAHDAGSASYGEEAAHKLHLELGRVFKTLVVEIDNQQFAVGIVPVSCQLDLKLMAKALGAKKAAMAAAHDAERMTGYVLGGISPLGQKRRLATIVDASAATFATIFVSAGRRGLELELAPADLGRLTTARFVAIGK